MTLQKAIKILDFLIEQQIIYKKDMIDPKKPWNQNFDCLKELAKIMATNAEHDVIILEEIKKQIIPKCKHPKKMQTRDSNRNLYCMNCNWDL